MTSNGKKVVVGMSGGVDSSVAAALLHDEGYAVTGLFMKNWDEIDEDGVCPAKQDYEDAKRVADAIGIELQTVNFEREYWDSVFMDFVHDYENGLTPNPDVLCNREIKFKHFYEKAMGMGADFLATGHYCRTESGKLLKGLDPGKDQSYFLYAVSHVALHKVLFPVGDLHKTKVREIAARYDLATKSKKDSTGICFIGERNFREFLSKYIAIREGDLQMLSGKVVGRHPGAAFFTLGQRKGLGIGASKDSNGEPWYVVAKDVQKNIVYVEQGEHPALYSHELWARDLNWVSGIIPEFPVTCTAKVRYRQSDQTCTILMESDGRLHVRFHEAQRAVTRGQSVVLYQNDLCWGGGVIDEVGPTG